MAIIRVPDYEYAGFYYPEIELSLFSYNRINVEELTSESEYEPHIQILRSFALVGHLNNTRLDIVANETMLDSAQLAESVRKIFKVINVSFRSASPATAELLIQLSRLISIDTANYIPQYSIFSTERGEDEEIEYEIQESLDLKRTDQVTHVFAESIFSSLSGTDGEVSTTVSTRFTSSGASFPSTVVGKTLIVSNSANNNAGTYIISQWVDANNIEVLDANFVTETSLKWEVVEYSSDYESEANTDLTDFTPWASFAAARCLYVGHRDIQWDQIDIVIGATAGQNLSGVWEYYDPTNTMSSPSQVVDFGGTIIFDIDSFLGSTDRQNSIVKVTYNPTGRSEVLTSGYGPPYGNYVITRGLLGQTTVDTNVLNYTIQGFNWVPLPNQVDNSLNLSQDGEINFDLPMTQDVRWQKTIISSQEAYFLRYRIIEQVGTPTVPDLDRIKITEGTQYVPFDVVQGETVLTEVLGSSDGLANQSFELGQIPYLDDTLVLEVDESGSGNWVTWHQVDNFLGSQATDRHYKLDVDKDGLGTVYFSDGTNGKIPPTGTDNIRASEYRIGGEQDGNVGARTIKGNDGGIPYVADVWNPQDASGWREKDGATAENLERLKESGPASIRNQGKAVSSEDIGRVAVEEYVTEDGSRIIERAFAEEEAYGPKTVRLVVVRSGGGFLTQEELDDVEVYFNGDRYSSPPVEGNLLLNSELTAVNYEPRPIDVTVQVVGKGITVAQVEAAISAFLNPLTQDDFGNYVHDFGGRLAVVKLDVAIDAISENITNIHRTVPASDVLLGPKQLPAPGTLTISIVESE